MPKYTLLDMVQSVLSDMNEGEVNSLDDTTASNQVATIVRDTYYDIINARLWPTHAKLANLTPSTDDTYPTHMKLPEKAYSVESVRYNTKDQMSNADGLDTYATMIYLDPEQFLDRMNQHNPANSNVQTILDNLSGTGVKLFIQNDKDPEFYTSFDDEWLVFDSFDASYDDTLQGQKTVASLQIEPDWTPSDGFIPDLPTKAFPLLLSESKKAAFIKLKQTSDPVEVERSRKQRTWMAGEKHRTRNKGINYPDYGRKRSG